MRVIPLPGIAENKILRGLRLRVGETSGAPSERNPSPPVAGQHLRATIEPTCWRDALPKSASMAIPITKRRRPFVIGWPQNFKPAQTAPGPYKYRMLIPAMQASNLDAFNKLQYNYVDGVLAVVWLIIGLFRGRKARDVT